MGLKAELVAATAPPIEEIEVAGVTVYVHGMGVVDALAMPDTLAETESMFWFLERMVRDESGARIFEDGDADLRAMDTKHINTMAEVVKRLLGSEAAVKN